MTKNNGPTTKESCKISHRFLDKSFCSNLNITPLCQILSKALEISRKAPLSS